MSRLQEQIATAFIPIACSALISTCGSHRNVNKVPESQLPTEGAHAEATRVIMDAVERKAQTLLKPGMSIDEVVMLMGPPLAIDSIAGKILMYNYADSVSGTFAYWVVFKDGRLDCHCEAQTTWLIEYCTTGLLLDLARKASASLRPGMSKAQVVDLLGQPREKQDVTAAVQVWSWSFGEGTVGKDFCVVLKDGLFDYFTIAEVGWLKDYYTGK